jgi:hypothetical protein
MQFLPHMQHCRLALSLKGQVAVNQVSVGEQHVARFQPEGQPVVRNHIIATGVSQI